MSRKAKADYWMKQLTAWHASQLSLSGYCRLHGLPTTTMRYWRQVLVDGPSSGTVIPAGADLPIIVPVPMPHGSMEPLFPLHVVVSERYRIEVGGDFDPGVLAKLVQTLEGVS
jgi:hypothetical protein